MRSCLEERESNFKMAEWQRSTERLLTLGIKEWNDGLCSWPALIFKEPQLCYRVEKLKGDLTGLEKNKKRVFLTNSPPAASFSFGSVYPFKLSLSNSFSSSITVSMNCSLRSWGFCLTKLDVLYLNDEFHVSLLLKIWINISIWATAHLPLP